MLEAGSSAAIWFMEAGARRFGRKGKPAGYMFQGVGVVDISPERRRSIPCSTTLTL